MTECFVPPRLYKFSMWQLRLNEHVVLINGKRNSGKSTLIADILYHHRHIRKVIVFSGSESANGFYASVAIPKRFIRDHFDADYLKKVYQMQMQQNQSCLIIFDDLSFDNKMWSDPTLIDLLYKGRHYGIGIIFAVQYVMHIPLKLRGQIDLVFVLKDNNYSNAERMHKAYFSFVEKTRQFIQIMQHFTADHGVLISDCLANEIELNKCMYWYKAQKRKDMFHVGCEKYRQFYSREQQLPLEYVSDSETNKETVKYVEDEVEEITQRLRKI